MLTPLAHLTDPSIPAPYSADETFRARHEALGRGAAETMETLQRRLGAATYTRELLAVRERARARREARGRKRKVEALVRPESFGRWKRARADMKTRRRKEKGGEQRARRVAGRYA